MDLAGWPRGTRAYTMDDVLAIIARQQRLNYAPGTEYSYTNSGYNLLAIIVQRVSGSSLADYTKRRIFDPLGMRSTSGATISGESSAAARPPMRPRLAASRKPCPSRIPTETAGC